MKRTDRIEIFCQKVMQGKSQSDAYRAAYPSSLKWADSTVHPKASHMMNDGKVMARLDEMRAEMAEKHSVTVQSLCAELEEARQAALQAETPQSSAAVAATMGKAKIYGLDKQVIDHQSSDGSFAPPPVAYKITDE